MIVVARSNEELVALDELLVCYEESLPPRLRHADFEERRASIFRPRGEREAAFLSWENGVGAGCVFLTAFDDSSAFVHSMFVRPEARKGGLGRALMIALIEHAKAAGFARILLDTEPVALRPAYELYRSLGFVDCAPFEPASYPNPAYMELPL